MAGHCDSKVQSDMAFVRHGLLLLSAICVAVTYASDVDDKAIAKAKIEVSIFCLALGFVFEVWTCLYFIIQRPACDM